MADFERMAADNGQEDYYDLVGEAADVAEAWGYERAAIVFGEDVVQQGILEAWPVLDETRPVNVSQEDVE